MSVDSATSVHCLRYLNAGDDVYSLLLWLPSRSTVEIVGVATGTILIFVHFDTWRASGRYLSLVSVSRL